MGVIQRQSLKSSIISYIGVAIGAVSTLFIYPNALEILGLFRSMIDMAVMVGIVVLMGSSISAVRFFPKYKDASTGHKGLLSWLLIVAGSGFLLFLLAFPIIHGWLLDYMFDGANQVYAEFILYVVPLTFFVALTNLLARYTSNFRRIAIPGALEQLTIKITLPVIVILYLMGWLTVKGVLIGVIASYAFSAFGLMYYLYHLGEWKLSKPLIWSDKPGLKEFRNYSWYGLLSGIGSQIAFRIDGFMVAAMIRFQAGGIYTIALTLSEVIIKPMRSLTAIAGPLIAHNIEEGNMKEVENIYRKSSLNMTIIGAGLFLLIWTVLPHIFQLMPNSVEVSKGMYVVFFLGLAQVWDMMTGVNQEIISYSKHYRFQLYLTLFLAVTNILANYFLIQLYGLVGAAMATCISMFLFNLAKLFFIWTKFELYPFTSKIIPVIGFAVAAWLIARWIPATGRHFVDILFKGMIFSILYGVTIWKLRISPDINQWIQLGWVRLNQFLSSPPRS